MDQEKKKILHNLVLSTITLSILLAVVVRDSNSLNKWEGYFYLIAFGVCFFFIISTLLNLFKR